MRIEQLLNVKNACHEKVYLDDAPDEWPRLLAITGSVSALPLLVNTRLGERLGNYDELQVMEDLGELDAVLYGISLGARHKFAIHELSLRSKER
jgi:hypothetical protein